jgi:hypothetical protein
MIQHRIPRRIAIAALHDHMLAEDALEREAKPLGRSLRWRIVRVALPFVAPIAELVEDVARKEILRLRRARRALQAERIENIADFDDPMGRLDAQEGLIAERLAAFLVDDREEQRVVRFRPGLDAGAKDLAIRIGPIEEIVPDLIFVAALSGVNETKRPSSVTRCGRLAGWVSTMGPIGRRSGPIVKELFAPCLCGSIPSPSRSFSPCP